MTGIERFDRGRLIAVIATMTIALASPMAAQDQGSPLDIRFDGSIGISVAQHVYEGPSGGEEAVEPRFGRLHASVFVGRRWGGYASYSHSNRPLAGRSRGGDLDRYALDAIGYRSYALGVAYTLDTLRETVRYRSRIVGIGPRISLIRNDLQDRIPDAARVAELGPGLGLDARVVMQWFDDRFYTFHIAAHGGLDLIPLGSHDFTRRRSWSIGLFAGIGTRIPLERNSNLERRR